MSNSRAYPILRTPDVGRALHAVGHVLTVADLRDTEVQLWARTGRTSGLPRYVDAYGQLVLNSADIRATEPADGHTVFVHVGPGEPERAEWLAGRAGLTVLGPGELGF